MQLCAPLIFAWNVTPRPKVSKLTRGVIPGVVVIPDGFPADEAVELREDVRRHLEVAGWFGDR
jgi:hypothetical protein